MLLYPLYYRKFGIRRAYNLVAPALHSTQLLDIPRECVIHYVGDDVASYGIPGDDLILQEVTRTILVDYVTDLTAREGTPRSTYQSVTKMIKDYQRKYRRFRQVKDLSYIWRDTRTLLVVDYALLHHLFKYVKSIYSNYFAWKNIQATLWATIGELTPLSDRQHLIPCRLPTNLPSVSALAQAEVNFSRSAMSHFTDPESLFILEIWKWLGKHREKSLLANLTQAQLNHVDLVWQDTGRWFVINLGLLDSWRSAPGSESTARDDDDDEVDTTKTGPVSPGQLQRRFLRLLMFLHQQRIETAAVQSLATVTSSPVVKPTDPTRPVTAATPAVLQPILVDPKASVHPTLRPLEQDQIADLQLDELEAAIDRWVDEDLQHLERIQAINEEDEFPLDTSLDGIEDVNYKAPEYTLEDAVMAKADVLADSGLMSAADYRRITTQAEQYKRLPDPYGKHETLAEQMVISKESLKIPDVAQIPDIESVPDKSMLRSSLFHFDREYTQNILPKDITNAVMSVQRAGVAVTGYTITTIADAMNSYDAHAVKLTPVSGMPVTIRFRVPKVNEDGTYLADGVRYRMRKQRGD
jgi:hypothetical protein